MAFKKIVNISRELGQETDIDRYTTKGTQESFYISYNFCTVFKMCGINSADLFQLKILGNGRKVGTKERHSSTSYAVVLYR